MVYKLHTSFFLGFFGVFMMVNSFSFQVKSQNLSTKEYFIKGKLVSDLDSLPIGGATIKILKTELGVITDSNGNFSIRLPIGSYQLSFSSIGYENQILKIKLSRDIDIQIRLQRFVQETKEVLIQSKRKLNPVKNLEVGVQRLEMKTIKNLPALLGEPDLIRTILTLPGISTVGEGATGFNVRGGGVDQNLVLMDGQEVFNSSHLFGFFSVYNPESVEDATLIKGGIPAQYGGRLASILDVRMSSGNPTQIEGSGGLGTVSSRFAMGGPISKGKSEFYFGARRSYVDLFLKLSKDPNINQTYAYFFDLNGKLNFHLDKKDDLVFTGYYGKDKVNLAGIIGFNYGNGLGGVNWKHESSPNFKYNVNIGFSNYDNGVGIPAGTNGFNYQNAIFDFQGKIDFDLRLDSTSKLKFGVSLIRYQIQPGKTEPVGDSSFFNPFSITSQRANEYGVYFQNEQKLNSRFSALYGLRLSAFNYISAGSDTLYSYVGNLGQPLIPVNPTAYSKGESIKTYFNWEPRLTFRYLLNEEASLKASYNRTSQYIHLISNTTAASPFDIWATTSNNIPPETADQISLGYFRNYKENRWESSLEFYYKKENSQIDFINGAQTLLNKNLEGSLLYGVGRSYGLELYLKKNYGKLKGWLSYTLSKTERKIDGINNDAWYPAKYDRPHNLSIVSTYEYNHRWLFSANFTLQSGINTTFPDSRYVFQGLVVPFNSQNSRNNYRLPNYNRLDLSATLQNKFIPGRKFHSSWVFSIYNVYGRRNAYSIYFEQSPTNPTQTEAVRLSIIGQAIPSVTWNFTF